MIAEEIMEIHRQVTPSCSLKPVFMLWHFAPRGRFVDVWRHFRLSQLSGRSLLSTQGREDRDAAC